MAPDYVTVSRTSSTHSTTNWTSSIYLSIDSAISNEIYIGPSPPRDPPQRLPVRDEKALYWAELRGHLGDFHIDPAVPSRRLKGVPVPEKLRNWAAAALRT